MDLIRSVKRACGLLTAFSPGEPRLTLADLSDRTGLPKPTAYRLASTLIDAGFMTQHADGRYGLGMRLIEVGSIARADLDLIAVCAPAMERLAEQTGETVLLGVVEWSTLEIMIVHRVDSPHELSVVSRVGHRSVLAPGAIGKALLMGLTPQELASVSPRVDLSAHTDRTIGERGALLAEIDRCRERGYATDVGEFIAGVSAVAAPVWLTAGGGVDALPRGGGGGGGGGGGDVGVGVVLPGGGVAAPTAAVAVVGPSTRVDERLIDMGGSVRDVLAYPTPTGQTLGQSG